MELRRGKKINNINSHLINYGLDERRLKIVNGKRDITIDATDYYDQKLP